MTKRAPTEKVTINVAGKNIVGYIRLRGGVYHVDVHMPDGDRQRWSTGERELRPATRKLENYMQTAEFKAAAIAAVQRIGTEPVDKSKASVTAIMDHYNNVHLKNRNATPMTIHKSKKITDQFVEFCKKNSVTHAKKIDRRLIEAWLAELFTQAKAPKTIQTYLSMVRAAINAAYESELIPDLNVRRWPTIRIPDNPIAPLDMESLHRVLEIIRVHEPRSYNIVLWLTLTGCRLSDAIDLKFKQVDLQRRVVQRAQVKTGRMNTFEISRQAASLIAEEKLRRGAGGNDHVFVEPDGEPLTTTKVYHRFTRTLADHGMKQHVHPHQLRHTFAFTMANIERCPLPTLQRMLGHSNIVTTMRYVLPSDGREFTESYSGRVLKGKRTAK